MLAWQLPARTADEVAAVIRALEKHRYIKSVDHQLHWLVDASMAIVDAGAATMHRAFEDRVAKAKDIDPTSRDPRCWRAARSDEVAAVLKMFWGTDQTSVRVRNQLVKLAKDNGFEWVDRPAFQGDDESPEHPQLVLLSWTLSAICDLDAERHAGALQAMEDAEEDVDVSIDLDQEAVDIGIVELINGAEEGRLVADFVVWGDGSWSYNDYVFRGVCRAAKLSGGPVIVGDSETK